jgi:hypothetical protein
MSFLHITNLPDFLLAASLGLMVFVVSVICLANDHLERKRLHREATMRRVTGEDTRPLQYLPAPALPWNHTAWAHLPGSKRKES